MESSDIIGSTFMSVTDSLKQLNEAFPGNIMFNSKNKDGGLQFGIKRKDKNIVIILRSLAVTMRIYGTESSEPEFDQTLTLNPSNYNSSISTVIKILGEKLAE